MHPNARPGMAGPGGVKPEAAPPAAASLKPPFQQGFTLIEILVVALIIGILATTFSLSIGKHSLEERLYTEVQRLHEILRLALEDAEAKGQQIGFRYTAEGYELLALGQDGQWTPIEGNGPLRARALGAPFVTQLKVEDREVAPGVSREFTPDEPLEPQVLLLSSGELTPFLLWLRLDKQPESGHILRGSLNGEIELLPWSREAWSQRRES